MGRRYKRQSTETKKAAVSDYYQDVRVAEICRKYEVSSGLFYTWKKLYDKGLLDGKPNKEAVLDKKVADLERMVGKLTMENELLKKAKEFFQERAHRKESLLPGALGREEQSGKDVK
jgi:transposase